MDKVPVEIASESPELYMLCAFMLAVLGIVIGVVYVCFKNMRDDRQETRQYIKEQSEYFVDSVTQIGVSCHAHQKAIIDRIEARDNRNETREERTVKALEKSSEALASNAEVLRDVRDMIAERETK